MKGAPAGAANLRWARDGRRLALRAGTAVWVYDAASQKFTKVCDAYRGNAFLSHSGNSLSWSPDGSGIAFAGTLEPAPAPGDPIIISRVLYKSRTALSDNRRSHIYVVGTSGGAPRAVTSGDHDEHSIDWAATGEIIFLSNRAADADAKFNYDIFAIDPASGRERQITRTPGVEMNPVVSPDGKRIAYIATTRAVTTIDSVAEDTHVWTIPLAGGVAEERNRQLDRRSFAPAWVDGEVAYLAHDRGRTLPFRGAHPLFNADAQVSSFAAAAGTFVFTMSDPTSVPEIYTLKGSKPARLTDIHRGVIDDAVAPDTMRFHSFDGTPVEGWIYLPPGTGRTPLILSVHGGPHSSFGYGFNPRVQAHASRGYATLMINPRGSAGYGQKFADGCLNDWGGGDYRDLMAGVDYALEKYPRLDPRRMVVTGPSYGGYMTNWIVTQTNRFRAAVAVASISNLISFYATSLYQDLVHVEFNGYPWESTNFERLWERSPLRHVRNVRTPVLFIHGERDNDVHITQAEEMYTALRQRGIEAVLARYPREGHGFSEPKHNADALERTLDWFDRFTSADAAPK
jgi:dipeptidyl aminopeptidase/acylaminoacyl peptidase